MGLNDSYYFFKVFGGKHSHKKTMAWPYSAHLSFKLIAFNKYLNYQSVSHLKGIYDILFKFMFLQITPSYNCCLEKTKNR